MIDLNKLGWSSYFEQHFAPFRTSGFEVGRVTIENRDRYAVVTTGGEVSAEVTGKLLFFINSASDLPKVGDWVIITAFEDEKKVIIHEILM